MSITKQSPSRFPAITAYNPTGANILVGKEKIKMSELQLPGKLDGIEVWRILAIGPAVEQSADPEFSFEVGDLVLMRGGTPLTPVLVHGYSYEHAGICTIAAVCCRVDEGQVRVSSMDDSTPSILLPDMGLV